MSVLYTLRIAGDPDEILTKVSSLSEEAWDIVKEHGFVGETIGRTDEGILIAEVWESHEGFQAGMGDPVVVAEFERLGIGPPEIEGPYPVIRDYQPGRAAA